MSRRLLLADDSITIQRVIELAFSGEDIEVEAVGDGEQAIIRIRDERPDIVLADIAMPKRNGYEVAAYVKGQAELQHIPVLLLAGAFEPVDQARAEQVRCDGVLVKPFEPRQIVERVRELLDREPPVPAPAAARVPSSPRPEAADEYLGRLDEALAAFKAQTPKAPGGPDTAPPEELFAPAGVPTIDDLLVGAAASAAPAGSRDESVEQAPASEVASALAAALDAVAARDTTATDAEAGPSSLADTFRALLAVERGDPGAKPPDRRPLLDDDLVEEVTRRVLARLAPDAARTLLAAVVSEVTARVVRDEGLKPRV